MTAFYFGFFHHLYFYNIEALSDIRPRSSGKTGHENSSAKLLLHKTLTNHSKSTPLPPAAPRA